MIKPLKYALITVGSVISLPIFAFYFLVAAYVFTLAQWIINGDDFRKPKTKTEFERQIWCATAYQYQSFTNLDYGMKCHLDAESKFYQSTDTNAVYTPQPGDKYYTYRVLGIMPIDAVFDANDNVILIFPTFDY